MSAVLVTRRLPSAVISKLEAAAAVDLYPGEASIPPAELCARLAGKDALICLLTDAIDKRVIDAGQNLKIVANIAVGYNNIDVAYSRSRGVVVTNTPDVLTESVANFTWAMILAVTRRLSEGERLVRRGQWKGWALDFMLGSELRGKQLGLVGAGRIARAVAVRAAAFEMRVAFTSRRETGLSNTEAPWENMSLDRLLNTSDIVSLHVPLTPETRGLLDASRLALLRDGACLVNTARGQIVDEDALVRELASGRIEAGLDVFAYEPEVPRELLGLPNVVLTPHVGSATAETREAMTRVLVDNLLAVERGEHPPNPV